MDGQKACSRIDLCPAPLPGPITPARPIFPSNLSDLTGEKEWSSWENDSGIGYFLHITDQHIDRLYKEGFNNDCGLPICCREQNGRGKDATTSGKWGSYQGCDIPVELFHAFYDQLKTLPSQPDFVLQVVRLRQYGHVWMGRRLIR